MFKERLRELRTEKQISQNQLAKELGISQAMISYWEKGTYEPTESSIKKVAIYFGVSADYLLGLKNEEY